jgi:hemolysin III
VSHGLGVLSAIIATTVLVTLAAQAGTWAHVVGFAVYGTTLFLSLLASALLHGFLFVGRYQRVLGMLDHCAIYLLIAGTYTPFCLTLLRGATGWWLLAVVWSLAVVWIVLKVRLFTRMSTTVSNLSYISLGWLVVIVAAPLQRQLGTGAVLLLVAAGVVYTLGAISFQRGTPNPFPPYFGNHELWHVAVLVGSGLMFCVLLFYVLPSSA